MASAPGTLSLRHGLRDIGRHLFKGGPAPRNFRQAAGSGAALQAIKFRNADQHGHRTIVLANGDATPSHGSCGYDGGELSLGLRNRERVLGRTGFRISHIDHYDHIRFGVNNTKQDFPEREIYPFTPVIEMPSIKLRCARRKSTITGRITSVLAAMR